MPTIPGLPAQIASEASDLLPISQSDGFAHKIVPGALVVTPTNGTAASTIAEFAAIASAAAPLDSPAFTGTPTAPTPAAGDSSTKIATTAFVDGAVTAASVPVPSAANELSMIRVNSGGTSYETRTPIEVLSDIGAQPAGSYAPLDSPALTGIPAAPTAPTGTNTTQIATTAFVATSVASSSVPIPSTTVELNIPRVDASGTAYELRTPAEVLSDIGAQPAGSYAPATGSMVYAPLASPALTGTPTAPTPAVGDSSGKIATTAFVEGAGYAPLASPALTGTPTAPTAATGTNTTQIATTAFVEASLTASSVPTPAATNELSMVRVNATGTAYESRTPAQVLSDIGAQPAGSYAPLASPAFTGTPTAPTPAAGDNTANVATTAFVETATAGQAKLNVAQTFTKTQASTIQALAYAATITPDLTQGNDASVTLTGNATLANPSAMLVGSSGHILVTQDSTGGRTLAYGTYWKFSGGTVPALSTAANASDLLVYWVANATTIIASLVSNI